MLIDVHAHYDDGRFENDREIILEKIKTEGVAGIINSGSSVENSADSVSLAEKYDYIYASVGVHPYETITTPDNTIEILAKLAENPRVCAIGEIGLDFYRAEYDKDTQRQWFMRQMDLTADLKRLPVVIHNRDAHGECLEIVKKYAGRVKGIFHCYAGSAEMARELIKLGYKFSIGGVCTFKNAKTCVEFIRETPIEYIMLETDSPYLAPHPHRGERNDSSYLHLIAEKIAEIKNLAVYDVIRITGDTAAETFGLSLDRA